MEPRGTASAPGGPDEILTVSDIARYLRVTSKTVYGLVRDGALRSFRVGRALRCRRSDVEAFISRSEQAGNNGQ